MSFYSRVMRPILFRYPPETVHGLTVQALKYGGRFLPEPGPDDYLLGISALGLQFPNPFGVAAGFDKNAETSDALRKLGFGFVEVGTLTPEPQIGNPRPRIFRLPDAEAVINRLGFNNDGQIAAYERLREAPPKGILGVNIGANKTATDRMADYVLGVSRFKDIADYLTINISSPNTPGLRDLQTGEQLDELLRRIFESQPDLPVLLKIAPDLHDTDLADITALALKHKLSGLIISNTTVDHSSVTQHEYGNEAGGLSGRPLMAPSTQVLRDVYRVVGDKITLIGVGGVSTGADAMEKIQAGASLVQLYTAMIYQGPMLVKYIKKDLLQRLRLEGFKSLADAVGSGT